MSEREPDQDELHRMSWGEYFALVERNLRQPPCFTQRLWARIKARFQPARMRGE